MKKEHCICLLIADVSIHGQLSTRMLCTCLNSERHSKESVVKGATTSLPIGSQEKGEKGSKDKTSFKNIPRLHHLMGHSATNLSMNLPTDNI